MRSANGATASFSLSASVSTVKSKTRSTGMTRPMSCGQRSLDARAGFSWLNRDSMAVSGLGSDLVLSVPPHKAYLGASLHDASNAHRIGFEARWVDAFPVHTGAYVGRVHTYTVVDARATIAVPFAPRTSALVEVSNVLNNVHQEFIGAPALGRLLAVRLRTSL